MCIFCLCVLEWLAGFECHIHISLVYMYMYIYTLTRPLPPSFVHSSFPVLPRPLLPRGGSSSTSGLLR